jgi:hypothetical protein
MGRSLRISASGGIQSASTKSSFESRSAAVSLLVVLYKA